ncbi:hypothetical protein [Streptomyces sp. NPDC005760]|uniref:hypothetical protein n=1 Tax=Streptomyces sp. NPDC005760 TaxID=3156718 RepID=UPI0034039EF3
MWSGVDQAMPWRRRCVGVIRFWAAAGVVRSLCAFGMAEDDVDAFVAALKEEMAR